MNKNVFYTLLIIISFLFILQACKKDNLTKYQAPVVEFISPVHAQEYQESDTLWVRLNLSSQDDLHEFTVKIQNVTENKEAFTYNGHSHNRTADLNLFFMPNVNEDADMKLTVIMFDHNGNQSSNNIMFKIKNTIVATRPEITIYSPNQAEYHDGNLVQLSGLVKHIDDLKTVSITLVREGIIEMDLAPEIKKGVKKFDFDTSVVVTSSSHAQYMLVVHATGENGFSERKTTYFDVHP